MSIVDSIISKIFGRFALQKFAYTSRFLFISPAMNLSDLTCAPFCAMLTNLQQLLSKAETFAQARQFDSAKLVDTKLFADMFPLSRQVQICCDSAKFCVARVAGVEAPAFADEEKTIPELIARIQKTIDFLQSAEAQLINADPEKIVEWKSRSDVFRKPALIYIMHWALPNFYFHLTTAYNLLRHNGVDIGKRDYLGKI